MRKSIVLSVMILSLLSACGGGGGGGSSTSPVSDNATATDAVHTVMNLGANTNSVPTFAAADLNGDGLEDVVISGWNFDVLTAYVYILIQNQDGTLSDKTATLLDNNVIQGSQRILISDFDSDGRPDIFIPGFGDGSRIYGANSVMLWGTAGKYIRQDWLDKNAAHGACLGDVNNDGKMDILAAGGGFTTEQDVGGIYLNDGARGFTLQANSVLGNNQFAACAVVKDGADSLIFLTNNTYANGYRSRIIKLDSNLTIVSETLIADDTYDAIDVLLSDINADGKTDFIVIENGINTPDPGPTKIYTNNGDGTFGVTATLGQTRSAFYGRALVIDGTPSIFISGDVANAQVYKGTTRYKPSAFTDMAGNTLNYQAAMVYQNATLNKMFILESINNVLKTKVY